ncbi:glycosyl transferase family 90 [Celerinatantimonas sp. YJH-8]|uniref:glycosyl transferase family 90 n=1 Tax=Celerinatantimonas sp. YJH-8 TaxID=3228714 RepID=UPI0038CA67F7
MMQDIISRIDFSKNKKLNYYLRSYFHLLLPEPLYRKTLSLTPLTEANQQMIYDRVDYYHKWSQPFRLGEHAISLQRFRSVPKKTYFFDLYQYMRLFPEAHFNYLFGDIRHVPDVPSFVKSRPIKPQNSASILLNLNKVRHFIQVQDPFSFAEKKPLLVWRGAAYQPHRIQFLAQYIGHPLCNIGQTNQCRNRQFIKPRMTIEQQLQYKFVLSLEGNDVASNLKWIMSSNSLAVMPKPKYETWFMEGRLQAGVHYVEIRPDYADLEEKMKFYLDHPEQARQIIANAQQWVRQFQDPALENTIALAVIGRYLYLSTRLEPAKQALVHLPARPILSH